MLADLAAGGCRRPPSRSRSGPVFVWQSTTCSRCSASAWSSPARCCPGLVRIGDRVTISPSGCRRGCGHYMRQNRASDTGRAGDRCALNLAGHGILRKKAIVAATWCLVPTHAPPAGSMPGYACCWRDEGRSATVCGAPPLWRSAEAGVHIVLLGDEPLQPGAAADVQLVLDRPIAAAVGIVTLSATSRRNIPWAAVFIDLRAAGAEATHAASAGAARGPGDRRPARRLRRAAGNAAFRLRSRRFARDGLAAARRTSAAHLAASSIASPRIPDRDRAGSLAAFHPACCERLAVHHADNPDLQGIGREALRMALQPRSAGADLRPCAADSRPRRRAHSRRRLPASGVARPSLAPTDEAAWTAIAPMLGGAERFRPPRVRDIATATGRAEAEVRGLLKRASRMGWADEAAHDHFFLRSTVREMTGIVAELADTMPDGVFTAAQFRDRVENGRKVAIQILEFFDRHGVTLRRGDLRRVNRHRLDLFGSD